MNYYEKTQRKIHIDNLKQRISQAEKHVDKAEKALDKFLNDNLRKDMTDKNWDYLWNTRVDFLNSEQAFLESMQKNLNRALKA